MVALIKGQSYAQSVIKISSTADSIVSANDDM